MTKEERDRLAANNLHWSRAWGLAALVRFAIDGRHRLTIAVPIAFGICVAINTVLLARIQRIGREQAAQAVALATFCALVTGAAADMAGRWWDVACLLCVLVAPVVWATSSIIWNLSGEPGQAEQTTPPVAAPASTVATPATEPAQAKTLVLAPTASALADHLREHLDPATPRRPPPVPAGAPAPTASAPAKAPAKPPIPATPPPIPRGPTRSMIQTITAFAVSANARRLALLRDVAAASDGLMTPTLARLLAGRGDDKTDRDHYLADAKAEAKDITDSANRQLAQALDELIAGRPDPEAPVEVELHPGVSKAVQWETHKTQLLSCELHAADVRDCLRRSGIAGSAWQIEKVDFVAWLVELRHGKELTTYKIPQGVRQNFAGAFLAFTDVVNPEAGAQIRVQLLRRALAASRLIWTP